MACSYPVLRLQGLCHGFERLSKGPAQAGWNAIANNGQGSGGRGAVASPASTTAQAFTAPFTAALQGKLAQHTDAATGGVTLQVDATLSGGATGTLQIVLHGSQDAGGAVTVTSSAMTLSGPNGSSRYTGSLQSLQGDGSGWQLSATLTGTGGRTLDVQAAIQMAPGGGVGGTLQAGAPGT